MRSLTVRSGSGLWANIVLAEISRRPVVHALVNYGLNMLRKSAVGGLVVKIKKGEVVFRYSLDLVGGVLPTDTLMEIVRIDGVRRGVF